MCYITVISIILTLALHKQAVSIFFILQIGEKEAE